MEQKDKELLLKDLCARLPYDTLCFCKWANDVPNKTDGCVQEISTYLIDEIEIMDDTDYKCQICEVKPYLRSMSSMTEEELQVIHKIDKKREIFSSRHLTLGIDGEIIDYLNRRMIDWRGLIDKGLALEASEGMYKKE